jgi:hypothetical protein
VIAAWLRRRRVAASILLITALIGGSLAVAKTLLYAPASTHIAVQATPITAFDNRDSSRTRFSALEFRGGLALTSTYVPFGGISALHMEPDGEHFLGVSDEGSWLRGRIVYRDGKPAGIADTEMAPLLGADGKPLAARGWYDAESLTELDGQFYIGLERVEQIVRFDIRRDGLLARGEPIPVPADFKTLTYNKSLECLAAPPKDSTLAGTLIVITEHSLDTAGNHRGFLLKGGEFGRFSDKRSDDFDVTDCAIMPPNDLLLLERHFSPARGIVMRIRRIPLNDFKPGALVDGGALIVADLGYQIDNLEGIGIHRNAHGETILTLVSDDNFSVLQRNLLLQFALIGE